MDQLAEGDSINCASKLQAEIRKQQEGQKKDQQALPKERLVGGVAVSKTIHQSLQEEHPFQGMEVTRLECEEAEATSLECEGYVYLVRPETTVSRTSGP